MLYIIARRQTVFSAMYEDCKDSCRKIEGYCIHYKSHVKMFFVLIAVMVKVITTVQSCENITIVPCPMGNMTCAKAVCGCTCMGIQGFVPCIPEYISCIDVLEEIPKMPDVRGLLIKGSNIITIKTGAFTNSFSLVQLSVVENKIQKIERGAFVSLRGLVFLHLTKNNITDIEPGAFVDLPQLAFIYLSNNRLTFIRTDVFANLPVSYIYLQNNSITHIESHAFYNLHHLGYIDFHGNRIREIDSDAFENITHGAVLIEIDKNFVMKENIHNNLTDIYFFGNPLNCNCSVMWFTLWLHDRPLTKVHDSYCANLNRMVDELRISDFAYCYGNREQEISCNLLSSIELTCTVRHITSFFQHWIHSRNGFEIRKLAGQYISNDTNILSIALCSSEDAGDYTCIRTTHYSAVPEITVATKVSVHGPPVLLNNSSNVEGNNLILSVEFYCDPYNEPNWILGDTKLSTGLEYMISTSPYLVSLDQRLPRTFQGYMTNLTIFDYKHVSSAAYTCKINNMYGEVKEMMVSRSVSIEMTRNTYCDTSSMTEIKCIFDFAGALADVWIHSYNGRTIRTLPGTLVNNTNILLIPFCNYQDMGDYTCTWRTNVPGLLLLNKTSTLVVNGPPLFVENFMSRDGNDILLSVFFLSQPFPTEPKWYFQGNPVVLGHDYQQATTFSSVTVKQHRCNITRQGFVSNLTIVGGTKSSNIGKYTCVVGNIFGAFQHEFTVYADADKRSLVESSVTIIVSTSIPALLVAVTICTLVILKRRKEKQVKLEEETKHTCSGSDVYDSIGLSGLPDASNDYIDAY